MLRAAGISYRDMENDGWMLVVRSISVKYHTPAEFDDILDLHVQTISARGARIVHEYKISRGDTLIVEATSEIACLNSLGKVTRLPSHLQMSERKVD